MGVAVQIFVEADRDGALVTVWAQPAFTAGVGLHGTHLPAYTINGPLAVLQVLGAVIEKVKGARLIQLSGGDKRNAIPRESQGTITVCQLRWLMFCLECLASAPPLISLAQPWFMLAGLQLMVESQLRGAHCKWDHGFRLEI